MNEIKVKFIPPAHWYSRAKWELLEDYTSKNQAVTVPVGFVTDGASIPLIFRWGFSATGKYFGAAIVHDYLLVGDYGWDIANREFDDEMRALNISNFRRSLIIGAVKLYSSLHK